MTMWDDLLIFFKDPTVNILLTVVSAVAATLTVALYLQQMASMQSFRDAVMSELERQKLEGTGLFELYGVR